MSGDEMGDDDVAIAPGAGGDVLHDEVSWLRLICDAVTDGVLLHERGRILRVNDALARMLGYTPQEMVGRAGTDMTVPEDRARLMAHIVANAAEPLEGTALRRDGSTFPCEVLGRTVRLGGRELRVVLLRDIGERRRAERELRRRERELASITEHTPDVLTRYDRDNRILFMSAGVERATGLPATAYVGRRLRDVFPAALADRWEAINARVFATGVPEVTDFEFSGPDGERRFYHTRIVPEPGPDGVVASILTTTRDLSELKRAEAAARAADVTLRNLVEQSLTGIYVIQDGRFAYVNGRFAEIFGYDGPAHVIAEQSVEALIHPDDVLLVRENLRRRIEGEERALHYTFRGRRRDGSLVLVEVFGGVGLHGGRPAVVGTLLDVTERVRAREALRASEARFRALVEHSADLIAILDADGSIRYASPSHDPVLGYAPAALAARAALDFVHPDDVPRARDHMAAALSAERPAAPALLRVRHGSGAWRSLEVVLTDMRHEPAVGGIVANSRDVTQHLALEEMLRHAQKMEALGQLAGGVAHDFNNLLAAISGYGQLLRDSLEPEDARRSDVEEILKAAGRGAGVTRQLLAFSRRQALETEDLDLAALARDVARMLRALLPSTVALVAPEGAPPVHVRAARAQLEQVILNLAVNARDAMPDGGTLTIDVRPTETAAGPRAVLAVRDTGVGMSPEVRARVFEPFFTTKPPGQGTGLGLSTVYGLVRQFGGTVDVETAEGRGTTFRIALPLVARAAEAAPPSSQSERAVARRRLLLVEDEDQVRTFVRRVLGRRGYEVVSVPNGAAALELLDADPYFDVVLSDMAMPEIGGRELAARLAAERPDLPLVLMSGYAELPAPAGTAHFIEKPFTVERLLDALERAMPRA